MELLKIYKMIKEQLYDYYINVFIDKINKKEKPFTWVANLTFILLKLPGAKCLCVVFVHTLNGANESLSISFLCTST